MNKMTKTIRDSLFVLLPLALMACTGTITGGGDDVPPPDPEDELTGAGGRDLTEYWPSIDPAFGDNTKMLNYEQMQHEVMRATGLSWTDDLGNDLWVINRGVLGGADYVTTFTDNREPSQQKIVTLRKMAFSVCGDLTEAEAGQPTRTVFSIVDPGATIDTADPLVADQVRALWKRFFFTDATQADVDDSLSALGDLQTQSGSASEAWRGVCAAYLSSMRFLTY